jgi:tRNA A22 N-methylase
MTQVMNLLKTQAKIILDIGCDHLGPNMAIVLFIHSLYLRQEIIVFVQGGISKKMFSLNVVGKIKDTK